MTDIVRNIPDPDPVYMRTMRKSQARAGQAIYKGCPHPMSAIDQFVDDGHGVHRSARPTNLFQCGVCGELLWLVDPFGNEAAEG